MSRHLENGERLNNVFAMGGLLNKHIRMTAMEPGFPLREYPSNSNYTNDDSVTQQGRRVSCSVDENDDLLIVSDENGSGLLLPYLGTVGTYTDKITVDGPVSWVCTGKFSGCSSYSVRDETATHRYKDIGCDDDWIRHIFYKMCQFFLYANSHSCTHYGDNWFPSKGICIIYCI